MPKRVGLLLTAIALAAGCRNLAERVGKSPLKPPQMSPETVVFDVFFVRFPFGQDEANGPLWEEIDETRWPADLRQRLARNGFRVGLTGGQVPVALSKLLKLKEKPPSDKEAHEAQVADLLSEPRVRRRHMPLRPGHRGEITASGVYDELALLLCEPGGLEGQTYHKAQGIFATQATPEPDGRVRLRLVPELCHGEAKPRFVGEQGAWRLEPGRPKRAFADMAIDAALAPGQMLVLGSLVDRPGSLGHRFFTGQNDGKLEQKLLVIRLSQTQHDGLFDPPEVIPLDVVAQEAEAAGRGLVVPGR